MTDEEFDRIIAFRKKHGTSVDPISYHGPMYEHEDGSIRQQVVVFAKELRIGLKFGFMQTIEKRSYANYDLPMVPLREGDITDFNAEWIEQINAKTGLHIRARPISAVEHLPGAVRHGDA
jgi:hypothetical protein